MFCTLIISEDDVCVANNLKTNWKSYIFTVWWDGHLNHNWLCKLKCKLFKWILWEHVLWRVYIQLTIMVKKWFGELSSQENVIHTTHCMNRHFFCTNVKACYFSDHAYLQIVFCIVWYKILTQTRNPLIHTKHQKWQHWVNYILI